MAFKKRMKEAYDRITNVGSWYSVSDVVVFVGVVVLLASILINLIGYVGACLACGYPLFSFIWASSSQQVYLKVFFILNTLISTVGVTGIFVTLYDKLINRPVKTLLFKIRDMGDDAMVSYLISGKLSRPFKKANGNETWVEMVEDYVDTASAEKYMDELTGCFNRKYFSQVLVQLMKTQMMMNPVGNTPKTYSSDVFGVFLVDIDHFKRVNDDFGHASGDDVLRSVGQNLRDLIGDNGVVIRNGGEEFLIIVNAKFPYDFATVANSINDCFRKNISVSSPITGDVRKITCSVGFVSYPLYDGKSHELSLQNHVDLADQAMYLAKVNGRDTWRELVAMKTPNGNTDIGKLCSDPSYGVDNGYVTVRTPVVNNSSTARESKKRPAVTNSHVTSKNT